MVPSEIRASSWVHSYLWQPREWQPPPGTVTLRNSVEIFTNLYTHQSQLRLQAQNNKTWISTKTRMTSSFHVQIIKTLLNTVFNFAMTTVHDCLAHCILKILSGYVDTPYNYRFLTSWSSDKKGIIKNKTAPLVSKPPPPQVFFAPLTPIILFIASSLRLSLELSSIVFRSSCLKIRTQFQIIVQAKWELEKSDTYKTTQKTS